MKFYKITLILFLLSFLNLSFKITKINYQIECVSLETDGYVTIKIWNTKAGKSYKTDAALLDAVHSVLYAGIAGKNGCTTQKALLNSSSEIEQFKKIEKNFFSKNGKWKDFTRSSAIESTLPINIGDKNWKVYQVSVSKNALRNYLEENKIIKSLNTNF
jgi:hypothetical protein